MWEKSQVGSSNSELCHQQILREQESMEAELLNGLGQVCRAAQSIEFQEVHESITF